MCWNKKQIADSLSVTADKYKSKKVKKTWNEVRRKIGNKIENDQADIYIYFYIYNMYICVHKANGSSQ